MAKLAIKKASTDVTVYCFIQDSSKTTGEGLAGLAYNTASLVGSYVRPAAARAALSLATQTVDGAHSDGGFVEIDATNMPGVYRLDLPDAVCATGVNSVVVMLKGAANMAPVLLEIQLTDFDLNTAAITAAAVADAVWDEATADHTTASSFGALDANVDAIKDKTDQLTFSTPNKVDASADAELSPEAIEDIWSSSIRTLTQSPAEIIATTLGADITQIRGNSWAVQLTGVVLESTQQFAIKYNAAHPDSAAILFVDSIDGLTVLNGIAQDGEDSSKASLVYNGANLTITVDASITAQLPVGDWQYGIQSIADNGVVAEPYGGSFHVLADVVRAID